MASREVFCGGELESVVTISGTPSVRNSGYDSAYSATSLELNSTIYKCNFVGENGSSTTVQTSEELWCHFYATTTSTVSYLTVYRLGDIPVARARQASGSMSLEINTSGTTTPSWTPYISYATGGDITTAFDFMIKPGRCELYVSNSLVGFASFSSPPTDYSYVTLGSANAGTPISQILVTENKSTVGAKVWTRKASGTGALSQMSGVYTSLVKTSLNDTTAIVSNAALQVSTFAYQDVTTPSGMVWGEVWVWSRAKNDGSAPTGLNGIARIGSVNYSSPLMQGIGGGFNGLPVRWKNNPATSSTWTDATFNAAEIGMESVA